MLRIDKVLKCNGWQDRDDDPFAQAEPALAELWKAALLGRPIDDSVALEKKAQLRGLPRPHGRNCAQMDGFRRPGADTHGSGLERRRAQAL